MRPVDKLVAAYVLFVTVVIVARGALDEPVSWGLLGMHVLVWLLLWLFSRLQPHQKLGKLLHVIYPILLTPIFYSELGILSMQLDVAETFARDAIVQQWESAIFGGQVSFEWIRRSPSVFWSGVLHVAYFLYYPIVVLGPVLLLVRGERQKARQVVLATIVAFVACYVVFVLFPVAGPNYAFEHPTGPVREVWSARVVYWILEGGSAFGTAFPSSHVAATFAATLALFTCWRTLALLFLPAAVLLFIGTVYCQMHYAIDAATGLAVGIGAGWVGTYVEA
jgi:membrane-associated phospholipid phosphatase